MRNQRFVAAATTIGAVLALGLVGCSSTAVTTASGGIVQVSAEGPFAIIYANPKDDPRNAGK